MSGKPLHGLSYTSEYRAWQTMRLRCTNPQNAAYPDYGGRGITVCDRWLNSVQAFLDDMGRKPSTAHELDRRENDGNYEPGNCRWVSRKVNDRNRRSNRHVTHGGENLTIAEWSERFGIRQDTLSNRLDKGWSVEAALSTPARRKLPKGQRQIYTQPCHDCGKECLGARCRPCENRSRLRDELTGRVLASNANFQHERKHQQVA